MTERLDKEETNRWATGFCQAKEENRGARCGCSLIKNFILQKFKYRSSSSSVVLVQQLFFIVQISFKLIFRDINFRGSL